eukprot:889988_1
MALRSLNPQSDLIGKNHALQINASAAQGLMNVLKSNLGPNGTIKMLVSGAGDVKLTKDGCVLLNQMQIQHPTAALIARTATAQDDITGDGTTSSVLFVGELLRQSLRYVMDGLHPRALLEGLELARLQTLEFIKEFATVVDKENVDRELLVNVARSSLRTKLQRDLADHLTEIVVDAVLCVRQPGKPIDLHMVEIMFMEHQAGIDSRLVKGLVLDHGARHPNMAKRSTDCFILTCNVSLEYEKNRSEFRVLLLFGGAARGAGQGRTVACRRESSEDHRFEEQSLRWKQEIVHYHQPKGHRPVVARLVAEERNCWNSSRKTQKYGATGPGVWRLRREFAPLPRRELPGPRRPRVRTRPGRGQVHLRGGRRAPVFVHDSD